MRKYVKMCLLYYEGNMINAQKHPLYNYNAIINENKINVKINFLRIMAFVNI
jgi:hypothetical protein